MARNVKMYGQLFGIICFIMATHCVQTCDIGAVKQCFDDFFAELEERPSDLLITDEAKYHLNSCPTEQISNETFHPPIYGRQCQKYIIKGQNSAISAPFEKYQTCFNSEAVDCTLDNSTRLYFYTNESYNYLCNVGRANYDLHASDCWFNHSVEGAMFVCYGAAPGDSSQEEMCQYMTKRVECYGDVTYLLCGKDAAVGFSIFKAYTQLLQHTHVDCPQVESSFISTKNNPWKTGARIPTTLPTTIAPSIMG